MKTKILSILALLLTVTQGAWAQTTADIGRVIAADGKMYKTVTLANKVSTASGVVAYVGSSEVDRETGHKYLAISLADIGQGAYGGQGNAFESTSDDLATVLTWINGRYVTINGHEKQDEADHPALDLAYNYSTARPSGASIWFVASVGQWNMVVKGLTGSNTDLSETENSALAYDKVNVKIVAAGATGLILAGSNYVLANPYDKDYVWEYMEEGYVAHWLKSADWYVVRPIFSFLSATNGYVVEYNANGGSGAPAAQSKTHGTALTLSSTVPTRAGYTFAGWATSAEGTAAYSAGGSYTTDNDIVLYAQWTPTYTATFAAGNDNEGWTIDPTSDVEGATVTVSYKGENKVKSVTVQKRVAVGHELSSVSLGEIICSDGLAYAAADHNYLPTGVTASGMVVYVGDGDASDGTYNKGLAISLNDVASNVKWGAQEDVSNITETGQNASVSMVDLRGIANTDAIVSKWPVGIYPYAAPYCRNISTARPSSSSNWFLPSQGQFVLMMNSYGAGYGTSTSYAYDNTTKGAVVTAINNALTNAGGTALSNGRYWTSTEVNQDLAGDWSASNSSFGFNGKTQEHYVRAMFAF